MAKLRKLMLVLLVPLISGQYQGQGQFTRPSGSSEKVTALAGQQSTEPQPQQQPNGPQPGDGFQYNAASTAVTELARTIGAVIGPQNNAVVFSPVSIACALSLMLLGAEQQTKKELIRVLRLERHQHHLETIHHMYSDMLNELASTEVDPHPPTWRSSNPCYNEEDQDEEGYQPVPDVLRLTNAVFVRDGLALDPNFRQSSVQYYNSTAVNLPFSTQPAQSAAIINDWVTRSTEGKIREIVPNSLDNDVEMIVASALYFKGLWTEMFELHATDYKPFYPDGYDGPSKQVLAMSVVGCFPYYDAVEYDAKVIGLSYQGNKSAMYIFLPNNSTRERLQNFQSGLRPEFIGDMVRKMTIKKVAVQIPKMSISNTINLRDVLQRLGLRSIFNPGKSDLSGMLAKTGRTSKRIVRELTEGNRIVYPEDLNATTERYVVPSLPETNARGSDGGSTGRNLHVSEFVHKVELDINELGTEGGAVTSSTIFRSLPSVQFRADAPFLLLLGHDQSRLPVFYGSIYDPSAN